MIALYLLPSLAAFAYYAILTFRVERYPLRDYGAWAAILMTAILWPVAAVDGALQAVQGRRRREMGER
jgi:hypothetical protein